MRERKPSREERKQREKTELSRQKLQEQAFLETQRNVFARIQRGEDYWDGRTMENWDRPPEDLGPPPTSRSHWTQEEWIPPPAAPYSPPSPREPERPPAGRDAPEDRKLAYRDAAYDYEDERGYLEDDRDWSPGRDQRDGQPDWGYTHLNPAITSMRWDAPEEPEKPKKSKGKTFFAVLLILLLAASALFVIHGTLVHPPELPDAVQEEGVAPGYLGAGRREGVYTFLLIGRDDIEGGGGNTDTIMVGCFDTENGTVDVLSIFRDTLVDVPWEIKKINSVYNVEGIRGVQKQVKNLIGYVPDYYFVVEMRAVTQLVDAIGGVDYDVPYNMDYDDPVQDLHIHFAQGMQHLNGEDAVKILRWRKNNSGENISVGDVGRVEIQHDFLKSVARQALSFRTVTKIRQLARIVDSSLSSNLSYGEMFWFGEQALGLQDDGIHFHSLPGDYDGALWSKTYQNYQSYVFVNAGELLDIVNQNMNPYLEDIPAESQHILNGTTVSSKPVLPGRSGG